MIDHMAYQSCGHLMAAITGWIVMSKWDHELPDHWIGFDPGRKVVSEQTKVRVQPPS